MKIILLLSLVFAAVFNAVAENVSLTQAGTLTSVLGDKLLEVEELSIEGPIDETDFNTLWQATYDGRLKTIDLSNAIIKDNKIPAHAFFHYEQADNVTGYVTATRLEKIVLPEGITEIGRFAFAYSFLEEIIMPSTVKTIDVCAFTDCEHYAPEVLRLPASLEVIGSQAFLRCLRNTEVILPEGIRRIESSAFYSCLITKINFPESLEYIGEQAFSYNKLTEITLPSDCELSNIGGQFSANFQLTHAVLPTDITSLPTYFFDNCIALTDITLPRSLTEIGDGAFNQCLSLSLIRCESSEPPLCSSETFNGVSKNIPVYIPTGTKTLYESATIWSDFTNLVETDMSSAALKEISIDNFDEDVSYDLFGKPLSNPAPGQIYIRNGRKAIAPSK